MKSRFCVLLLMLVGSLSAQNVRLRTNVGDIDITLLPQFAPRTVQNFLNYANRGAYNGSIFHRLVNQPTPFVLQGGGYRLENGRPVEIPQDPPVVNEFRVSNTQYTIAMAKLGDNPNSATNQFFINLANNAANLNNQNGGFTVFASVDQGPSRDLVARLAQLPTRDAGSPFDNLPVINAAGDPLVIESVEVLRGAPAIADGGVISASNYGAYRYAAPGSFIEIYGRDLAINSRTWESRDFTDGRAPTTLEEVSVLINGVNAFVYSVTPTQLNVQVPANVPTSGNVPVEVRIGGNRQISNTVQLAMRPTAPGLLAPDFLRDNERTFAIATRPDGSLVTPQNGGATKGETLTFYGVGFGAVSSAPLAGQIVTGLAPLLAPVEFRLRDVPAQVTYAGLAPGFVGLYQFNVTIPPDAESRDHELTVTVAGERIPQTLFVRVR